MVSPDVAASAPGTGAVKECVSSEPAVPRVLQSQRREKRLSGGQRVWFARAELNTAPLILQVSEQMVPLPEVGSDAAGSAGRPSGAPGPL